MPGTLGSLARSEALRSAGVAAATALALAAFGPPPGDLPAHLYRTELVERGVLVWDGFWYGGHYPLFSYSLLYYFPAALLGNDVLAVAAVIAGAALFAAVAAREWGERAVWPSRAFAVAGCAPLFTGTYPYAVGVATALGTLRAFQAGHPWLGLAGAGLTLGVSPLAFLFLCLVVLAAFLARPRPSVEAGLVGAGLLAIGGAQAVAVSVFHDDAHYPFFWAGELGIVLLVCLFGGALALRAREARILALIFVFWALASVVAFAVPSPLGENVTRLRGFVFPLVLLAAVLARFRPLWLAVPTLVGALAYTLVPYVAVIPYRTDARPAERAFWEPAFAFLRAHADSEHRVEVVPTGDHWEAYWLPHAGFPLARGWYRQLDIAQNGLFYEGSLEPVEYREWLRANAVRYVVLPHAQLGRIGEEHEADLLRSGAAGLRLAFRSASAAVYELRDATSLLTGPGEARVTVYEHERLEGRIGAPGRYRLRVRYTPHLRVERGEVCLARGADGMTELVARRPGPFVLAAALSGPSGC
jgi:hypothetical protein